MKKFYILFFKSILYLSVLSSIFVVYLIFINMQDLPDYKQLKNYEPPIITRFYAADGKLLEEYAKEHRLFVPIEAIPKQLQLAFIAAEDKNFYDHSGVDVLGIVRALAQNIINYSANKKGLAGGSTITQQVVKNFLLNNEKSINRKIKEAILSLRISKLYSKNKILELYLNQIYLGSGSYGVTAAALIYFNKSINELTLEEAALLASLPKAPSTYNPRKNYQKALDRRNWVINRMYEEEFITKEEALQAINTKLVLQDKDYESTIKADYFAEAVRKQVAELYGEKSLYEGGLYVRTTLKPELQSIAQKVLRQGILNYDFKRGFIKPLAHINDMENWQQELIILRQQNKFANWQLAVIFDVNENFITVKLLNNSTQIIKKNNLHYYNLKNSNIKEKFLIGDVIYIEEIAPNNFTLRQKPRIDGGIVAMDVHSGKVYAMVGGYDYENNQFNRVTQAMRQPGSVFKTFVYLAALENNYLPNDLIDDSPIELEQGPNLPLWTPRNYHRDFLGPTTLRRGLELSRNTMTVNLAQDLGIDKITEIAKRFHIDDNPLPLYSMVLGAMETNLLKITNAHAMIVNGGKRIFPSLIEKIQDRNGKVILYENHQKCLGCKLYNNYKVPNKAEQLPYIIDLRESVTDERSAYQVISFLEGYIQHTKSGALVKNLGRTLGGKTGTTNNSFDSWYIGFTPDLIVGVFLGYDEPKTLGKRETGATLAQPVFVNFAKEALANYPDKPFRVPNGIKTVKIDYITGEPKNSADKIIFEHFKQENAPNFIKTNPNLKNDNARKIRYDSNAQDIKDDNNLDEIY